MLLNLRSVFTYTVCIHIRICLPWVLSTHLCAESLFSWIVARLSPRASTQPRQRTYATHAYLCHLVPMVRVLESLRCGFLRFASSSIRFSCRRFLVLFLSFPLFWSQFFFFFLFFLFVYVFARSLCGLELLRATLLEDSVAAPMETEPSLEGAREKVASSSSAQISWHIDIHISFGMY